MNFERLVSSFATFPSGNMAATDVDKVVERSGYEGTH